MSQIEKEFLAEECGLDDSHVYNSGDGTDPIMNPCKGCAYQNVVHKECFDCVECSEFKEVTPISFAPHHHQKILDRTKIRTAQKRDKSGEFTINGERFMAELEVVLTVPAFISLFDSEFYTPDQFGFDDRSDMWRYYSKYFLNHGLIFVHKISEVA